MQRMRCMHRMTALARGGGEKLALAPTLQPTPRTLLVMDPSTFRRSCAGCVAAVNTEL